MSKSKKFLIGLAIAIGFIFAIFSIHSAVTPKTHEYSTVIAEGTYVVDPLSYKTIEFTVPYWATNPKLALDISEKSGKDIAVEVVDSNGLTYYDSGRVQSFMKTIYLDSGKTYYIVLNNKYSLITPKKVYITAILYYEE